KSEAGLATLMDLKVNTGGLAPLSSVLTEVATSHSVRRIADLSKYEAEIMRRMKYRADFSKNPNLTQPAPLPTVPATATNAKKVAVTQVKPRA
ncbi:hypothetical protein ABTL56_19130, partial [Acinetobacter baumannii]